jgi:hypothetical protein
MLNTLPESRQEHNKETKETIETNKNNDHASNKTPSLETKDTDPDLTLTIDESDRDFVLAHQLAHALRTQDTDKFIFIYDNIIPDDFDQARVNFYIYNFPLHNFFQICQVIYE